jgi:hypothetical protein
MCPTSLLQCNFGSESCLIRKLLRMFINNIDFNEEWNIAYVLKFLTTWKYNNIWLLAVRLKNLKISNLKEIVRSVTEGIF